MADTVIAGKPSNTVGNKDSVLVLRGSSVKVQWGNKFIDLIKNGKVNAEYEKILKTAKSSDELKADGIYLIEDQIWVSINGTKVQLAGNSSTVYVSFVEEQEVSPENKSTALKNIGFIYNSLEEASGVTEGIIYVLGDNKLYHVVNGQIVEYVSQTTTEEEKVEEALKNMLYIEEYSLFVDGDEYIRCENSQVTILKQLITENGIYSSGASSNYGYKLYIEHGKSILEVDEVRERNPKYISVDLPYTIYTQHNNIVEKVDTTQDNYICTLQEANNYQVGDYVYIYTYCIIESSQVNGSTTFTLSIPLDSEVVIEVDDSTITIPKNTQTYTVAGTFEEISIPKLWKVLREYEVIKSEKQEITLDIPESEREMFLQNCTYLYDARHPYLEIENNNLKLLDRSKEVLNDETNELEPDNTIHSKIGIVKESEIESLKISEEIEEEYTRPDVGIYSDNLMALNPLLFNSVFKVAGEKDKETEHPKYPKYSEDVELPEHKLIVDKQFNQVVPDFEWIKKLMDLYIPIGTIVMWYGSTGVPPGWKLCNGKNGTPNLVDRFIKGGNSCGEVNPEGVFLEDDINKFKIEKQHLPGHQHSISAFETSTEKAELSGYLNWNDYLWGLSVSKSTISYVSSVEGGSTSSSTVVTGVSANTQGGAVIIPDHSHTVNIPEHNTNSHDGTWGDNNPITIEPKSYKLVFIMKVKNLIDVTKDDVI